MIRIEDFLKKSLIGKNVFHRGKKYRVLNVSFFPWSYEGDYFTDQGIEVNVTVESGESKTTILELSLDDLLYD